MQSSSNMNRGRPAPLVLDKVREIVRKRTLNSNTVDLGEAHTGPESPLTPQILEGNAKFDKYMQSKIMVWHKNKQRDLTISDQVINERSLKKKRGGASQKYT